MAMCYVCNASCDGNLTDNSGYFVFCSETCGDNVAALEMIESGQVAEITSLEAEIAEKQSQVNELRKERNKLGYYIDNVKNDFILRVEAYRKYHGCSTLAALDAIKTQDKAKSEMTQLINTAR